MRLDFYYWGAMCPLNLEMIDLLQAYRDRIEIHTHDITGKPELAAQLRMFYPTLTVIDQQYRYFSPLGEAFLQQFSSGILPEESPYRPVLGQTLRDGTLVPMTKENVSLAGSCVGHPACKGCRGKADLLAGMGLDIYGFLYVDGKRLLGGAEYVPASQVPYPVAHDAEKAFITCVYLSDSVYDDKSAPLAALEQYLAGRYQSVLVVSDEDGVFPNGNLAFFQKHQYRDLGIVTREPGYCTLHLLEKQLV